MTKLEGVKTAEKESRNLRSTEQLYTTRHEKIPISIFYSYHRKRNFQILWTACKSPTIHSITEFSLSVPWITLIARVSSRSHFVFVSRCSWLGTSVSRVVQTVLALCLTFCMGIGKTWQSSKNSLFRIRWSFLFERLASGCTVFL